MKKRVGVVFLMSLLSLALACGGPESVGDDESSAEQEWIGVHSKFKSNIWAVDRYECRCYWDDDDYWPDWADAEYHSEEHCLDDSGALRDEDSLEFCLEQVLEDIGPFEGDEDDFEDLVGCWSNIAEEFRECVEEVPETCSEFNTERLTACDDDGNEAMDACFTVAGTDEVSDWLDKYIEEAVPRCGLPR